MRNWLTDMETQYIGKPVTRVDTFDKVTGRAVYGFAAQFVEVQRSGGCVDVDDDHYRRQRFCRRLLHCGLCRWIPQRTFASVAKRRDGGCRNRAPASRMANGPIGSCDFAGDDFPDAGQGKHPSLSTLALSLRPRDKRRPARRNGQRMGPEQHFGAGAHCQSGKAALPAFFKTRRTMR